MCKHHPRSIYLTIDSVICQLNSPFSLFCTWILKLWYKEHETWKLSIHSKELCRTFEVMASGWPGDIWPWVRRYNSPPIWASILKERPLMLIMVLGNVAFFKRTVWSFCFRLFVCVPEQCVFKGERALPSPARLKMSDAWRIPKMGKTQPYRLTSSAEFLARKNVCNHSLSPRLPRTQECSLYETCQWSIRLEGRRWETNFRGGWVEKAKVTRVSLIFKHLDTCWQGYA